MRHTTHGRPGSARRETAWSTWGRPSQNGRSVHGHRSTTEAAIDVNGYSIVQAEDAQEAIGLLVDHPYLALGDGYTVEVFELL
jgi:hypothetical protein